MFKRPFFFLLLILPLTGCTVLHDEIGSPENGLIPESYSLYTKQFSSDAPWWLSFESDELDRLIRQGLENNHSLHQTWARLVQARSLEKKAGSDTYPKLDATAGAAHNRSGQQNGEEIANDDFSLGVSLNYEVDLWGRIRASSNEANQITHARQEDVYTAAISLSSTIAETWLELISTRQRILRLEEQLKLNSRLLELVELRFATAKASALDVYQQRQTIKAIEGALINLTSAERLGLNQLAVLTGRSPGEPIAADQNEFPKFQPVPPGGLPTDLLSSRPDILAAEYRLKSASWSITAAKADRLPRIRLTGNFSYNSGILESLLDTWLLRLAAEFTGPVFDGGEKKAEVERRIAVAEELLAGYRQTVLNAILEVEDSLIQEKQFRESVDNIKQQITLTRMAYREATWRYLNGLSDYLPVLREQINLISLQQDLVVAEKNILGARVTLHKALGGTWTHDLTPTNAMSLSSLRKNGSQSTGESIENTKR